MKLKKRYHYNVNNNKKEDVHMKHLKINKIRRKGLVFCFVAIILLLITFGITTFAATKEYYLGDTNLDNEITLSDELLIKRHMKINLTGN